MFFFGRMACFGRMAFVPFGRFVSGGACEGVARGAGDGGNRPSEGAWWTVD
jgi:hypothetical protein